MTKELQRRIPCVVAGVALIAWMAGSASAQNVDFQDFFFDVCAGNPSGALAARCAETPLATGDLSADSEDSLNPSQALTTNAAAQARARAVGKEIQERLERGRRKTDDAGAGLAWSILAHVRGESVERDATGLERGFEGDLWGTQLGADVRLSDRSFVGALLSYDTTDSEFDADQPGVEFTPPPNDGETDADSFSLTFYGSHRFTERAWIDGSLGYGQTDYEFRRNAVFQEANRVVPQTNLGATTETDGDEVAAGLGIGYDGNRGRLGGSVYGRLNYARVESDAYTESDGSGLQMRIDADRLRSLTSIVGLQGSHTTGAGWGVFVLQARVEYERELEDDPQSATTRFVLDADANSYLLFGDEPDQDAVNAGLGMIFVLPRGWITFLEVEVLGGHDFLDRQRVTLGLRKEL